MKEGDGRFILAQPRLSLAHLDATDVLHRVGIDFNGPLAPALAVMETGRGATQNLKHFSGQCGTLEASFSEERQGRPLVPDGI